MSCHIQVSPPEHPGLSIIQILLSLVKLVYANKLNLFWLTHLNPNWFTGCKLNVFRFSSME
jgi:hypothetical protein